MKGFEKDVGSKTTLRITYPEGAMQRPEQYERDSLFVLAGFKWQDFKWLKYIVYKERVVSPASAPSTAPASRLRGSRSHPTHKEQIGNFKIRWPKAKKAADPSRGEARQYQGS